MDRNKLLKQTEKDLENFMKVYPTIMTFDGNAARKIKGELESRYNFQAKAIQREKEAEAKEGTGSNCRVSRKESQRNTRGKDCKT